ncbi:phospholipase D-like domain-containing protein [Methylomonas sp. TEB]|uniref:phospholipase D-like domain-containing protein n=1 Tax=Methylomonas sp. TEB TaxID=3398229 RepID=UPI0039F62AB2
MQNISDIKIISNTNKNHLQELCNLISVKSSRLIIASPFLAPNIGNLLDEFDFSRTELIELITTFKAKDPEQLTKPGVLKDFFEYFYEKYPRVKVKVHVDNQLHGKIYVSINNPSSTLLLSSANFTRNGLQNNHEWGITLSDSLLIEDLLVDLFEGVEYPDVTYSQIKKASAFADIYMRDHPEWIEKSDIYCDILENVYSDQSSSDTVAQYFLKPIGSSEVPVTLESRMDFSDLHQNLHFSQKPPRGVKKGDILITTAIGAGSLLSYFKVTGGLQRVTEAEIKQDSWKERWPWYMEGKNQSKTFGAKWWEFNIRRQDALAEFLEKYPGKAVTYAGGYSLGSINRGNDKVRITKEFGDFLIAKIHHCTGK